jgi:hypothetical protein
MSANKKRARIIGALFLTVMVTWGIGYALIGGVIDSPDYLTAISEKKNQVIVGALVELIEIIAVVGIVSLMFPLLKKQNESLAIGYAGFRILECSLLIASTISPLLIITIGEEFLHAGAPANSYFQTLGTSLIAVREHWGPEVLAIFYNSAALIFFYLMYRSKLIPRLISICGLVGVTLSLTGTILGFFGSGLSTYFGLPMGLIEILLGLWLIIKGFNSSDLTPETTNQ